MIEDTFEELEAEGLDEEADSHLDAVISEITDGLFTEAGTAPVAAPSSQQGQAEGAAAAAEPEGSGELDASVQDMHARLQAL